MWLLGRPKINGLIILNIFSVLSDKRYLTWEAERVYESTYYEAEFCSLLEYYETNIHNSLPMITDQISFPTSKVKKSKKKIYLKMQSNTFLTVRQFQPAHTPLITELCGESIRIVRLNAACPFFTCPLTCRVWIVFSVQNISDCHRLYVFDMEN